MADASPSRPRPLSPHVWHWRWHVTMAASILNRMTGVALYAGLLLVVGWAWALASGEGAYSDYLGVLASWLGRVILIGVTFSAFFHLAAGLRHLAWDSGNGFAPKAADSTAWAAFAVALIATVATWWFALSGGRWMSGYRTPLARARGLGSAKRGVGHFIGERVSSVALIALTIWAIVSAVRLAGRDYDGAVEWLRSPVNATMLALFIVVGAYHMQIGMRVIVEDYIERPSTKAALLLLNLFIAWGAAALALVSVMKVAVGGWVG